MENHQTNNINNSSNILMKTSQYTPQSIPIPTNVSTNYSSFDGIDNIEKTLEEVKELIEKSKALSLGEIVSPSNNSTELDEKMMNSTDNSVQTESEIKNETKIPNDSVEKQIVIVEKETNTQEGIKKNS